MSLGGGGTACTICQKTAYPAETVSFDKKPYHVECFRCSIESCNKKITVSAASAYEDKIYCKQCFANEGFAQKQRNVKWTPKATSGDAPSSRFGGGGNPCTICAKTVYPAETVSYDKKIYHVECFKCKTCSKKVTGSNASAFEDNIYCKKCFAEGGFAQKQRNVKWEKKESSGSAIASKFGGGGTKCQVCDKTVYPAETVSYEKLAYHQECFKCVDCNKKVTTSSCGKYEDKLYCTLCFQRGGYNKKQAKVTTSTAGTKTYDSRFAKFGGGGNKCVNCDKTVYPAEQLSFEKKIFHINCFVCSHDGCSKKGRPITTSDAQYKKNDDGSITIWCTKCYGELRIGRT